MDLLYALLEGNQLIYPDFFLLDIFHFESNAAAEDNQNETKPASDPPSPRDPRPSPQCLIR